MTVEFAELPDGRTQMNFTHKGLEASLTGHKYGWTSTFDRLDLYIDTHLEGDLP